MRQSDQKNYSIALRKLTASAIDSVFWPELRPYNPDFTAGNEKNIKKNMMTFSVLH